MDITKPIVQARLESLQSEFNQTRSKLEALHGAIQDCQFWLSTLDQEATGGNTPVAKDQ